KSARAALLALHLAAAGRDEAASTSALAAAEDAVGAFAFKDAEFFFQLAMSKAPDVALRTYSIAAYIDFLCRMERFEDAQNWLRRWRASAASCIAPTTPKYLQLLELHRASIAVNATDILLKRVSAMGAEPEKFGDEVGYRM